MRHTVEATSLGPAAGLHNSSCRRGRGAHLGRRPASKPGTLTLTTSSSVAPAKQSTTTTGVSVLWGTPRPHEEPEGKTAPSWGKGDTEPRTPPKAAAADVHVEVAAPAIDRETVEPTPQSMRDFVPAPAIPRIVIPEDARLNA